VSSLFLLGLTVCLSYQIIKLRLLLKCLLGAEMREERHGSCVGGCGRGRRW